MKGLRCADVTLMPWKWQGIVLAGGTSDDFVRFAKSQIDAEPQSGAHACGHCYVEYGKPWLIWVQDLADVPALAHEALHCAAGILEARGMKFSDASEEAYTYTMEDILRQTLAAKWRAVKRSGRQRVQT